MRTSKKLIIGAVALAAVVIGMHGQTVWRPDADSVKQTAPIGNNEVSVISFTGKKNIEQLSIPFGYNNLITINLAKCYNMQRINLSTDSCSSFSEPRERRALFYIDMSSPSKFKDITIRAPRWMRGRIEGRESYKRFLFEWMDLQISSHVNGPWESAHWHNLEFDKTIPKRFFKIEIEKERDLSVLESEDLVKKSKHGDYEAHFHLALRFAAGVGVEESESKALYHWQEAKRLGGKSNIDRWKHTFIYRHTFYVSSSSDDSRKTWEILKQ